MSVALSLRSVAATPLRQPATLGAGPIAIAPPPCPTSIEDAGLSAVMAADLTLKVLLLRGTALGYDVGRDLRLPFSIVEPVLMHLKEQKLLEVVGGDLLGPVSYKFALTDTGRSRAREAVAACQYVGPAPVTLEQYVRQTELQSVRGIGCTRAKLRAVLPHLVLPDSLIEELGPAIVSGRSILLFGPSGSGKTSISRALGEFLNRLGGAIWVPTALLVENSIITVFDPQLHDQLEDEASSASRIDDLFRSQREPHDARWRHVRRPVVIAGGELTLEMLDLRFSAAGNFYQAPVHIKANGGVLVIDDFGRQVVSPRNLLNRWILPLEERQDYLSLATGKKVAVPFEQLVVFSTNLDPAHLADEAFLRRIRHKIYISPPDRATYTEIFCKICQQLDLPYRSTAVDCLYNRYYDRGREPRSSDPRDLLEIVVALCRFRSQELDLSDVLVLEAADRFFGSFEA